MTSGDIPCAESLRLAEDAERVKNWKRWGPYLAERQWGTVREDYSEDGTCWDFFPHEHARSRAYRWGEDGLLGLTDRECRLCFALALWNGRDPILKERLFGLTGPQGNHGEDVKECYFYLDSTPTHSYVKSLYKYPQSEFPYTRLIEENHRRGRGEPEFELSDTGVFEGGRYFDVFIEYAKNSPDDLFIRVTVANRGPERATFHLLPTLWFRNTWTWGRAPAGAALKPGMTLVSDGVLRAHHETLGKFRFAAAPGPDGKIPPFLFTENETNFRKLFGVENAGRFVKDAFHDYVIHGQREAVNSANVGSKAAAYYRFEVPAAGEVVIKLRLCAEEEAGGIKFARSFDRVFLERRREADEFYGTFVPLQLATEERRVVRQCYAGLLQSKQFYHYIVRDWLEGDPTQPPPSNRRKKGRNHDWQHLYNRDVISMPDKWEYPWYAAWDLAFHAVAFARIDPGFAKEQLILFLREWTCTLTASCPLTNSPLAMSIRPFTPGPPGASIRSPAPRASAIGIIWHGYFRSFFSILPGGSIARIPKARTSSLVASLASITSECLTAPSRSPLGATSRQADGTAWMAFFCTTMLAIALKLAERDPAYEDMASKFFEHFVAISDAINTLGGTGLWDEKDGFYHDQLSLDGECKPLRIRSMVGLIPLFAVEVLEGEVLDKLPGFSKRMNWFLENRQDLGRHISYMERKGSSSGARYLLGLPSRERLVRMLRYVLDENEFLSPCGIRSLSKAHEKNPYVLRVNGEEYRVEYNPAESSSGLFGGNSNWRGPIWFPVNYLLMEALERFHHFYGDSLRVECPVGSGRLMNLLEVSQEIGRRLSTIFLPDANGRRPCHGEDPLFARDPHWRELLLFHEYFHGDTGRGLGANHQTGWTALAVRCLEGLAKERMKNDE